MTLTNLFNLSPPISGGGVKMQDALSEDAHSIADGFQRTLIGIGQQSDFSWPREIQRNSMLDSPAKPKAAGTIIQASESIEEAECIEPSLAPTLFPTLTSIEHLTPVPFNAEWTFKQKAQEIPTPASPPVATNGVKIAAQQTAGVRNGMGSGATTSQLSDAVGRGSNESFQTAVPETATFPVLLNRIRSASNWPHPAGAVERQTADRSPQKLPPGHSLADGSAKPTESEFPAAPTVKDRPEQPVDRNITAGQVVGTEATSSVPTAGAVEHQIVPAATTYVQQPRPMHRQLDGQETTEFVIPNRRQASVRDVPGLSGFAMTKYPTATPEQSPRNVESSTDTPADENSADTKPTASGHTQAPLLASTSRSESIGAPKSDGIEPILSALNGTAEGLAPVEQLKTGQSLAEMGRNPLHLDNHGPRTIEIIVTSARALVDRPVELTLNPEELGRVRMMLVASDDGMTVQLTVERPETLDLLRRNIDILASDLRQAGYERLSFGFAGDPRSQGNPMQHQTGPVAETLGATEQNSDPLLPVSVTLSPDGLDLRI